MFVSLPMFLNQHGQQWQNNLISVHALWMDALSGELCKPITRMFTQEKPLESIMSVWSSRSFKWLFDESVVQPLPTQVESLMEGKQQKLANKQSSELTQAETEKIRPADRKRWGEMSSQKASSVAQGPKLLHVLHMRISQCLAERVTCYF